MHLLRWANNTCTVGHTCIHAFMTADDMRTLIAIQPDGWFSAAKPWVKIPKRKLITPDVFERYYGGEHREFFHYTFRYDDAGKRLLHTLFVMGMDVSNPDEGGRICGTNEYGLQGAQEKSA